MPVTGLDRSTEHDGTAHAYCAIEEAIQNGDTLKARQLLRDHVKTVIQDTRTEDAAIARRAYERGVPAEVPSVALYVADQIQPAATDAPAPTPKDVFHGRLSRALGASLAASVGMSYPGV